MTDPERISKRGAGLAAQLLQAGADEQPSEGGAQRTLVALGVSGVVLTSTSAVSAAAGAKLTSVVSSGAAMSGAAGASATIGVLPAVALAKWIGIGVVAGIGVAGAAAVATAPSEPPRAVSSAARAATSVRPQPAMPKSPAPGPPLALAPAPEASRVLVTPLATANVVDPPPAAFPLDVGAPLSAEVAVVDRGRSLLGAGRASEALAQLEGYEREFSEARLLPEVLFLRLEAYERLGRSSDARRIAARLVRDFPKSPHAARARKLLTD
ncbi:MAG TPA: hypothetical protein VEQ59_18620 [Polyangiaceae bacterium]|nr:hypothetical protein [Polyangiaceae bacterium]